MKEEEEFCFRVVVLQAIDVSEQYSDVFCQFKWVTLHWLSSVLRSSPRVQLPSSTWRGVLHWAVEELRSESAFLLARPKPPHQDEPHVPALSSPLPHHLRGRTPPLLEDLICRISNVEDFRRSVTSNRSRRDSSLSGSTALWGKWPRISYGIPWGLQLAPVSTFSSRRMSTKLTFQQPSLVISTPVKSKKASAPVQSKCVARFSEPSYVTLFSACRLFFILSLKIRATKHYEIIKMWFSEVLGVLQILWSLGIAFVIAFFFLPHYHMDICDMFFTINIDRYRCLVSSEHLKWELHWFD